MHGLTEFEVFEAIMGTEHPTDESACWEWAGGRDENGYGKFGYAGSHVYAHVVSFRLHVRELQPGEIVRHAVCDNPPCQSRFHLRAGSHADNAWDKVNRDRQARGEQFSSSKLTDDTVRAIRVAYAQGVRSPELARLYGVHKQTIMNVVHRQTWMHVE